MNLIVSKGFACLYLSILVLFVYSCLLNPYLFLQLSTTHGMNLCLYDCHVITSKLGSNYHESWPHTGVKSDIACWWKPFCAVTKNMKMSRKQCGSFTFISITLFPSKMRGRWWLPITDPNRCGLIASNKLNHSFEAWSVTFKPLMLPNQFSFLLFSCAWCLTTNHQQPQPIDIIDDLLDACRIRPHLDPWQTYLKVTRCKFSPISLDICCFSLHSSCEFSPYHWHWINSLRIESLHMCVYGLLQNCYLFTCGCVLGCVDCDLSVRLLLWTVCLLCSAVCVCIMGLHV